VIQIQQQFPLQGYNTFGMNVAAKQYMQLTDESQLKEISTLAEGQPIRVLGGGSNVLLTHDVTGLLVHNMLKGTSIMKEDEHYVWLKAAAGENWHAFVMDVIARNLGGIENLALIPGTVGAAPIQNIGAYGVEVKDTIEQVTAWHWDTQTSVTYTDEECTFGYRDSIFKKELKDKVCITSVVFRLNKQPVYHTEYGAIRDELATMGVKTVSIQSIAQAVINIRNSKLPDPNKIHNAGSFFKNPTISTEQYTQLQQLYPTMQSYPVNEHMVKVPAGWLIEQCGWKGYRNGDAGVHQRQALVLVNYGNASGNDILRLSDEIIQSVAKKFGIVPEREVNIW
jgi:UDP-N-acetylmuramate dehydrogenase